MKKSYLPYYLCIAFIVIALIITFEIDKQKSVNALKLQRPIPVSNKPVIIMDLPAEKWPVGYSYVKNSENGIVFIFDSIGRVICKYNEFEIGMRTKKGSYK